MGPTWGPPGSCRPQIGPCWPHEPFYQGMLCPISTILWLGDCSHHIEWCSTVYPKKYAHGFCFAVLCCGNTLTDFPISIRLASMALWQSNDCPSASKATLTNMDKYFMWIHYERLHNHNKAKHNKTVCIFLEIYCNYYRDFILIIPVQFIMSANSRLRLGLHILFGCLYITPSLCHHCVNSFEDIEVIKCLSNIFCRVCE